MLARELLSKPDGFLLAKLEDKEYVIDSLRRTFTCANIYNWFCNFGIYSKCFGKAKILYEQSIEKDKKIIQKSI